MRDVAFIVLVAYADIERNYSTRNMNLKIVFRILRRMSLWSLEYYSDVHVAGREHIPKAGPLIVCVCLEFRATLTSHALNSTPCHHNEIIDIATLCSCSFCVRPPVFH